MLTPLGWNGLSAAEGKVIAGEYVSIIQHPSGERKQLALRENQVVDVLDSFLHYRTDTSPGSSGSPVFNDQWEVVALHHSGVPKEDAQGRLLTRDGKVWTKSMGEHHIHWIANEGVRISRILKHLEGLTLLEPQAMLRKEAFDAEKGWQAGFASGKEELGVEGFEAERDDSSWSIPLQLTIDVLQPRSGIQISAAASARRGNTPQPTSGESTTSAMEHQLVSTWPAVKSRAPGLAPESAAEWLIGDQEGAAEVPQRVAIAGGA
jgi:hypothetical protein